jgi:hypothetical protein
MYIEARNPIWQGVSGRLGSPVLAPHGCESESTRGVSSVPV